MSVTKHCSSWCCWRKLSCNLICGKYSISAELFLRSVNVYKRSVLYLTFLQQLYSCWKRKATDISIFKCIKLYSTVLDHKLLVWSDFLSHGFRIFPSQIATETSQKGFSYLYTSHRKRRSVILVFIFLIEFSCVNLPGAKVAGI